VNPETAGWTEDFQRYQLPWTAARILAVVPGYDLPFIHVSLFYRSGQPIVVDQGSMTVAAQPQITGKTGPGAESIHVKVSQVNQVIGVGQVEVINIGFII
jgi:hypothetical protein